MPNGSKVWIVIAFSSLAWIFSVAATGTCTFMKRAVEYSLKEGDVKNPLFHDSPGVGFFSADQCYSYTIGGKEPNFDSVYGAARAFTGVADFFGGIAIIGAWFTACFPADKAKFRVLAVLLLVVSLVLVIISQLLAREKIK